jgi:tetratricopeptide (TPR) repeat protein
MLCNQSGAKSGIVDWSLRCRIAGVTIARRAVKPVRKLWSLPMATEMKPRSLSFILFFVSAALVGVIVWGSYGPESQDDMESLHERGYAEFKQEQYDLSVVTFTKWIEAARPRGLDTEFGVYGLRGISYYKLGEFQKALKDTDTALSMVDLLDVGMERHEMTAKLHYQRGMIHLALEDEDSATSDFSNARKYDPEARFDPRNRH